MREITTGRVYCLGIMILKHPEVLLKKLSKKKSANKEDTEEDGSGKTVEAGLNKETAEFILGSPEEINDVLEKTCFGLPVLCPMLAVGVGAAIVLLVALR
jgi:hypothetical protein